MEQKIADKNRSVSLEARKRIAAVSAFSNKMQLYWDAKVLKCMPEVPTLALGVFLAHLPCEIAEAYLRQFQWVSPDRLSIHFDRFSSGILRWPQPPVFSQKSCRTNGRRTAVQMGGVLQYKWEVYCWVALSSRLRRQEGTAIQMGNVLPYKLEVYCSTFSEASRGWGSETFLISVIFNRFQSVSNRLTQFNQFQPVWCCRRPGKRNPRSSARSPDKLWWGKLTGTNDFAQSSRKIIWTRGARNVLKKCPPAGTSTKIWWWG